QRPLSGIARVSVVLAVPASSFCLIVRSHKLFHRSRTCLSRESLRQLSCCLSLFWHCCLRAPSPWLPFLRWWLPARHGNGCVLSPPMLTDLRWQAPSLCFLRLAHWQSSGSA